MKVAMSTIGLMKEIVRNFAEAHLVREFGGPSLPIVRQHCAQLASSQRDGLLKLHRL